MSSDAAGTPWAVRFEGVSKRYAKGDAAYPHLGSEIVEAARRSAAWLRRRPLGPAGTLALDDVSLEVAEGECFGLVGGNGAGKTTALRLVSRITSPTGGRVRVRGRVGALMEVGSGVHPELTGRENVWLYGSILGMSRGDIRRRFDEIVEFAQVGDAIDTQVKYYSSGMQLRLGFSVAAHLEPDVLVVDEALSVGDASFQSRAVRRMRELVRGGTTVLLVSHDLWAIEALCGRAALIDHGRAREVGDAKSVLATYLADVERGRSDFLGLKENRGQVRITEATCHGADGGERYRFTAREPVELRLRFVATTPVERPHVVVTMAEIECSMLDHAGDAPAMVDGAWECSLLIDALPLRPRLYEIWCTVLAGDGYGRLMDWLQVGALRVEGVVGEGRTAVVNAHLTGSVLVDHRWRVGASGADGP